jgi:squalene-associated FAD-dependent desaturase
MKNHVVIIGGGFAGASAASALAEAGIAVTLLEKRTILGGRASSLRDGVTREDVDNGQHLFMGCYRETRRFLARLKVSDRLRFLDRPRVAFLSPQGRSSLTLSLGGILTFRALSWGDKFSLVKGLLSARFSRRKDLASLTVTQWLDSLKQSPGARRAFWTPLCLSALNADPSVACAAAFEAVLRLGLFGEKEDRTLGYSTLSLGKLWPVDLPGYLKERGGVLSTEQSVTGLEVRDGRVTHVKLESGQMGEADAVICATSLPAFMDMCPPEIRERYAPLAAAESSPILSVNLWFEKLILDELFAASLDTGVQWIFNRAALWEGRGASPGYYSLVISDARAYAKLSADEIVARCLSDLRRVLPGVPAPRHAAVTWEREATPSPTPAFWRARPPSDTSIENLFLAGDWVDSGLPPTIEAACKSGHAAARAVKDYLDKKSSLEPAPC